MFFQAINKKINAYLKLFRNKELGMPPNKNEKALFNQGFFL
jgi:hypothetical protein